MIQFTFQADVTERDVAAMLGSLGSEAKPVLKRALNATAKEARKRLAKTAQQTYSVKTGGFNRGMKVKNASNATLSATIQVTGRANELKAFKVSPATYKTGAARPPYLRAKVLQKSSLKKLEKGGTKAFLIKFAKNNHVTVVERKGSSRFPVNVLYSPSDPAMVGSKQVYGLLRPEIGEMLQREIIKQVDRQLRKGV